MDNGKLQSVGLRALLPDAVLAQIINAVTGIRFGAVEIVVHEGNVVQIERKEKLRFARPS